MTPVEQIELAVLQEREVQELRNRQLSHYGRIYDSILRSWLLADGTVEAAFAGGDNAAQQSA